jgi:hypothetical protein
MRTWPRALALAVVLSSCGDHEGLRVVYRSPQGAVRYDRDGDGFAGPWECPDGSPLCNAEYLNSQPVPDLDCDDYNPRRHPGAADLAGDGIDSNCDGVDGIAPVKPVEPGPLNPPGK